MDNKKFNIAVIELFLELKSINEKLLKLAKEASRENILTDATREILDECALPFLEAATLFNEKEIY